MTTYCAPCLADLALVRDAVTSVSGTAACVAHAVLLSHTGDNPQRRLTRLSDLRAMAEEKLPTASDEDRAKIELLVQEYALAGAMDMTVPLKDLAGDRTPRPPKNRRDRGRDRGPRPEGDRGPRPEGDRGPRGERGPRPDVPAASDAPATESSSELSGAHGAPAPSQPDSSQAPERSPELSGPEGALAPSQPDNSQPDNSQPDSSQPDSSQPDNSQPDSSQASAAPDNAPAPAATPAPEADGGE